jgi:hypothetical protein
MKRVPMTNTTGRVITVLLIILIGVVSYGVLGKKAESSKIIETRATTVPKTPQKSEVVATSSTNDIYKGITDAGFVTFASIEIDKRCPFYKPDGVSYKQCLSDWVDELSKPLLVEQIDEVYAYCEVFSKKYSESISFEQSELFTKCSIYKLQP